MLIEFICDNREEKLLKLITSKYPEISFNSLNKILRKKDIRVNGKKVADNVFVRLNDSVQVYVPEIKDNPPLDISIVYQDQDILVAEKPAGIETEGEKSLQSQIKQVYANARPCHRLDRNTVGLIVFSLNEKAYQEIIRAFNLKQVEKRYLALCSGYFDKKTADLSAFLFKDSKKSRVYINDNPGKGYVPIQTQYTVLDEFDDLSLVEVNLITGRTHQIRAHMAHIGHPVLGDGKYGKESINKRYGENRQQLYAYKIKFNLPGNSPLKQLNSAEIENKLYKEDLLEFKP